MDISSECAKCYARMGSDKLSVQMRAVIVKIKVQKFCDRLGFSYFSRLCLAHYSAASPLSSTLSKNASLSVMALP